MSFSRFGIVPARVALLSCSLMILFAACGDAPEASRHGDSATASTDASRPDEAPAPGPDGDTAADGAVARTPSGDSVTREDVSDSIGFPASKPVIPGQRYNVRSGIVELKSSFMGDLRQTIYFDDYGRKEAVHANVSAGGTTNRSVMVMANGSNVIYDPVRKSGTRIDMADALSQLGLGGIPNLSSLDANQKRELKYQPIAGRTVLGKQTEGASIEVMGTPLKVWTWEGVPLRMEASMQGNQMVVEATSIKTDVAVPADRFVVPPDVKITEYDAGK
jgi:hypothetical protein